MSFVTTSPRTEHLAGRRVTGDVEAPAPRLLLLGLDREDRARRVEQDPLRVAAQDQLVHRERGRSPITMNSAPTSAL